MTSALNQFKASFDKGIAKANKFTARITPPAGVQMDGRLVEMRLQSVAFPGKNIVTTPNDNAYGPSYEIAQGISYAEDVEMTFILDPDHRGRWMFNDWQDNIVDPSSYDLNYYDEYKGTMDIFQLDDNDIPSAGIKVFEVFPKTLGPIGYDMNRASEIQTMTVSMAFKNWAPIEITHNPVAFAEWVNNPSFQVPNVNFPTDIMSSYNAKVWNYAGVPPQISKPLNQITSAFTFFRSITRRPRLSFSFRI